MKSCTLAAALITASCAAGALASSAPVDYSTLPPGADAIHATLTAAGASLADAIKTAESQTGGKAKSATFSSVGASAIYTVVVFTETASHTIVIDAATGAIKSNESKQGTIPGWDIPAEVQKITTSSGLMYYDIVTGAGPLPAGPTARVEVHYTGYLVDGKKFDSSVDRGKTSAFGLNQVIKGWTEGVGSMHVGGKRKLLIPFHLAYGPRGRPGSIPPRALLVFDIELISLP